jgi:hypothetical protein
LVESSDVKEIVDDNQKSELTGLEILEMSDFVWKREEEEQQHDIDTSCSLKDNFDNDWINFF